MTCSKRRTTSRGGKYAINFQKQEIDGVLVVVVHRTSTQKLKNCAIANEKTGDELFYVSLCCDAA